MLAWAGARAPWARKTLLLAGLLAITPAFAGSDSPVENVAARIRVSAFHATRYYEVTGATQEEIWAGLHSTANPLAPDGDSGARALGHASFQYRYAYQSAYGASPSTCRVDSGELVFRFETVLPQLVAGQGGGAAIRDRWQNFQQLVSEHEAGHQAIYEDLASQLPRVLANIGEVPCGELAERVRVAVAEAVSETRQASAAYDRARGGEDYLASSL